MKLATLVAAALVTCAGSASAEQTYTYVSGKFTHVYGASLGLAELNSDTRLIVQFTFANELAEGVNQFGISVSEEPKITLTGLSFTVGDTGFQSYTGGPEFGGNGRIWVTNGEISAWAFGFPGVGTGGTVLGALAFSDGSIQYSMPGPIYSFVQLNKPGVDGLAGGLSADRGQFYVGVVPEPSTYAMMLAGIAVAGVAARRVRRG